jgi:extracellular factor (EF) 3-hydroxypalmitic acid methyl ester biosynthesis protein
MSYVALDIFEQLRQQDIQWILASSEVRTLSPNSVLVREDDPSEAIYFIADGLLEVYVFGGPASKLEVGQLGPGEVIGEISWLDRKPISASVRAVETSAVMALGTALLEKKLRDDPGFAARFFRGIATLTAGRLRKTTADLRRSEWAAGQRAAAANVGADAGVLHKIGEVKALLGAVEKKGAAPDDDARKIKEAFDSLVRSIPAQGDKTGTGIGEAAQAELVPLVKLSATGSRLYAKPRGYAGDYQAIDTIYDNAPAGIGSVGAVIDACMLDLPVLRAIRNRRRLLATEILSSYRTAAKELHVASLACGSAREIFDVFEKVDDKGRLHISCIDVDREALTHIGAQVQKRALGQHVRTLQANLIQLATGRQELELAPLDLIYAMNFIDYLSDELAIALINWTYDKLRPGGRVILGNFHPRNPTRGFMDQVLDWHLTHRDESEMNRLFASSKFAGPCSRIFFEEEGIDMFAECRKP